MTTPVTRIRYMVTILVPTDDMGATSLTALGLQEDLSNGPRLGNLGRVGLGVYEVSRDILVGENEVLAAMKEANSHHPADFQGDILDGANEP